jgi:hypothetical protein
MEKLTGHRAEIARLEAEVARLTRERDRLREAIQKHLDCDTEDLPPCEDCDACEERFVRALGGGKP